VGRNRWSAGAKLTKVLPGSAGAEDKLERVCRSPGRRKALKREAHERWGLKEASKDEGARRLPERVAKPWGETSWGQAKTPRQEGFFHPEMLKGRELTRGTDRPGSWSTWNGWDGGKRRRKTLKVASKCRRGEARSIRKGWIGAARDGRPEGPGEPKDERGGGKR